MRILADQNISHRLISKLSDLDFFILTAFFLDDDEECERELNGIESVSIYSQDPKEKRHPTQSSVDVFPSGRDQDPEHGDCEDLHDSLSGVESVCAWNQSSILGGSEYDFKRPQHQK